MKERKKPCKRPSIGDQSAEERSLAHKVKMQAKKKLREYYYNQFSGPGFALANLGVNHPDYGMTVSEHEKAKTARKTEKSS